MTFFLRIAFGLGLCCLVAQAQAAKLGYQVTDQRCGGLAKLAMRVADGFCVGLAARHLGAPRGVLPLADGRVLVTDMGRWDAPTGRLLLLEDKGTGYASRTVLKGLDRPHGLQLGPDGQVYLAQAGSILRLDMTTRPPAAVPVLTGLPATGRHPIKNFVFGPDGALYLSRGAPSDHCEEGARIERPGAHALCAQAEGEHAEAAIWRYAGPGLSQARVFARGLRNSTALAVDPRSGRLWQGENSRDELPGAQGYVPHAPHDELNLVVPGAHFGWPYCHDRHTPDPTFGPVDCSGYQAPARLLPPHSAPLGLAVYDADQAPPAWRRTLLVTLHGYQAEGHRIIAFGLDDDALPTGDFRVLVDGWGARPGR
ncbi:MAG: hypothetical protein RL375_3568, partial [Pseudomonadota bacterium]